MGEHLLKHGLARHFYRAFGLFGMYEAAKQTLEFATHVKELAEKFKISTERAQELEIVAKRLGMDVHDVYKQYVEGGERFYDVMREMGALKNEAIVNKDDIENLARYARDWDDLVRKTKAATVTEAGRTGRELEFQAENWQILGRGLGKDIPMAFLKGGPRAAMAAFREMEAKREAAYRKIQGPIGPPVAEPELPEGGLITPHEAVKNIVAKVSMVVGMLTGTGHITKERGHRAIGEAVERAAHHYAHGDALSEIGGFVGGAGIDPTKNLLRQSLDVQKQIRLCIFLTMKTAFGSPEACCSKE